MSNISNLQPAIILSSGSAIGLSVVRELGEYGVPVYVIGDQENTIISASKFCKEYFVRPKTDMSVWLSDMIRHTGAKILFAISENDLIELAKFNGYVAGCNIVTPSADALEAVLNKNHTLQVAQSLGFSVPDSWQPTAPIDDISDIPIENYPVVLKWANPQSVFDVLESNNLDFQKSEYVFDRTQLMKSLRCYNHIGRWPIVQQYCMGVGIGQILYMYNQKSVLSFQHQRIHEWPPEGGISSVCGAVHRDVHHAQFLLSEKLLIALGWTYHAMVEYRYDRVHDKYWLMEINGRFWGSVPLARYCGVHFAWESYRRLILNQTDDLELKPYPIYTARYMVPETKRLIRILFQKSKIKDPLFKVNVSLEIWDYIREFFNYKSRYYILTWRDIKPFLFDMTSMLKKLFKSIR